MVFPGQVNLRRFTAVFNIREAHKINQLSTKTLAQMLHKTSGNSKSQETYTATVDVFMCFQQWGVQRLKKTRKLAQMQVKGIQCELQ